MVDILKQIVDDQLKLVALNKEKISIDTLCETIYFDRKCISFKEVVNQATKPTIIAEFKRRSPSKPAINLNADINTVPLNYQANGANALSILTNEKYFGGNDNDVIENRSKIQIPILRKEFIIDEYQLYEAKAMGADIILLIAECLTKDTCKSLASKAKELGLEVLLELHNNEGIDFLNDYVDFLGINNRNLKTFETSIEASIKQIATLPKDIIKVSESGIGNVAEVVELYNAGYKVFLIGEHFMKNENPGLACGSFINEINEKLNEN